MSRILIVMKYDEDKNIISRKTYTGNQIELYHRKMERLKKIQKLIKKS